MNKQQTAAFPAARKFLTTEQLADELGASAKSILQRHSKTGSFHGLIPVKLPSRRLAWPVDSVEQLLAAGE